MSDDNVVTFTPPTAIADNTAVTATEEDSGHPEVVAVLSDMNRVISERQHEMNGVMFIAFLEDGSRVIQYGGSFSPTDVAGTLEGIKLDIFLQNYFGVS
jgi:hypothetical protein